VSWFSGSRLGHGPLEAVPTAGHRSPALKAVIDALNPRSRHSVLDLGPPLGSNVEFLSARACRVRVADFHRSLGMEPAASKEPAAFAATLARLLPIAREECFDAVLSWDLFNYLRPDQIAALMAWIAPSCHARTLVLALIWNRPRIPLAPLRYRIVDSENVAWLGPLDAVRAAPRHSQPDLARMMPTFAVKASFLLRNGIQEYLFASRPAIRAPE
jgi:hypothetical protein